MAQQVLVLLLPLARLLEPLSLLPPLSVIAVARKPATAPSVSLEEYPDGSESLSPRVLVETYA